MTSSPFTSPFHRTAALSRSYATHAHRGEGGVGFLEVETFARFLQETYDPDDLLFFLCVRQEMTSEQFSLESAHAYARAGD